MFRKLLYAICRILEITSCIGLLASTFVMIWLQVKLGIQILLTCFILFMVFTNLAERLGSVKDNKD